MFISASTTSNDLAVSKRMLVYLFKLTHEMLACACPPFPTWTHQQSTEPSCVQREISYIRCERSLASLAWPLVHIRAAVCFCAVFCIYAIIGIRSQQVPRVCVQRCRSAPSYGDADQRL